MTDSVPVTGSDRDERPKTPQGQAEATHDDDQSQSSEEEDSQVMSPEKASQDIASSPFATDDSKKEGENDGSEECTEGEDEEEDEEDDDEDDEDDEEEEEEDEEPQLKYAPLTQHLRGVYRNGDATSAFLVAGDKMIIGTHNGNINVVQLPVFQSIRVYHAHSASVTGISISPFPPPLPNEKTDASQKPEQAPQDRLGSKQAKAHAAQSRKQREPQPVPKTPSNDIYIATASMDGNVCVQSLVDLKDVQLRNFARPVQAVALSPEYKSDRTYLSGGLAGQLILTVGGGTGRSTSTTTGGAAATASGWLGSIGIGSSTGKDTILHSGEGTINSIQWSLSGKYVVWLNEHGIKVMRTHLHLDSAHADDAWKRVGHIDRPQTDEWEAMASVWKGRAEWIDENAFESQSTETTALGLSSPAMDRLRDQATVSKRNIERLLVGWGGIIWIIHVHPTGKGKGKHAGEIIPGDVQIVKMLRLDCIVSGVSLYTPNLLLVLAYCSPEEEEEEEEGQDEAEPVKGHHAKGHKAQSSISSIGSQPSGGIPRKANHQRPELRLIDLGSSEEVSMDSLNVSRYERLSARDYHLGILPPRSAAVVTSSRGVLEALGGLGSGMWNAAVNPVSLFSSGASVRSQGSGDAGSSARTGSTSGTIRPSSSHVSNTVHPNLIKPGAKIFIHSPYDCILATKRDLSDHLGWLLERQQYRQAWELLDEHPDILSSASDPTGEDTPTTPRKNASDDLDDDISVAESSYQKMYSSVEREKRRIGELWISELVEENKWLEAGQVCSKVLTTPDRWEKWVWTFAKAQHFDEITNYIPTESLNPPLPTTIYEVVLGHYIKIDKPRFRELLDRWSPDLFNISTITTALENQLKYRDVREDTLDHGEKGRDWRIVMESLARLHEANGRHREALKCYIKLQDADSTFRLIRDSHLADSVADDIPSFIGLRVSPDRVSQMSEEDLENATSEAITLLVEEAQHGLVRPHVVVEQLQAQELHLYLFFYLRGLWRGEGLKEHTGEHMDRLVMDSQSLVDEYADLTVHLFAMYDRTLLMEYLKSSTSYALEKVRSPLLITSIH